MMKRTLLTAMSLCGAAVATLSTGALGSTVSSEPFVTSVADETAFDEESYTATDGHEIYDSMCAGCHMPDGGGAIGAGAYPALKGNANLVNAVYPINVIIRGQAGMPAVGEHLSDEQVLAVTSYIQSDLDNGYEPNGSLEVVAATRPAEPEEELAEHEIRVAQATGTDSAAGDSSGSMDESGSSGVIRHPIPGSDFPIALAIEIPADATLVYLSGAVPQVIDENAEDGAPERYGDTTDQTVSTLESIEGRLESLDLGLGDIVKMQVYLVAPEGADGMDFGAFMEGYVQYFGTEEQPNLPTRSAFEIAGLANPAWLVEIEVVAVRPE